MEETRVERARPGELHQVWQGGLHYSDKVTGQPLQKLTLSLSVWRELPCCCRANVLLLLLISWLKYIPVALVGEGDV